jgi:regulatory protein
VHPTEAACERALDPELRLQHALELAFRFIGPRERTVLELRRQLEGKRVEPATIERALAELAEQGYLDDARFAQRFAEDKRLLEDWGAERIERRLLALGVDAEVVRDAVAARDRGGELTAAVALLRRRFPWLGAEPRERERAFGMLVRKGYEPELAADALRAHGRGDAG